MSQRVQPGGMAAFLLGNGPMPPPRPEEVAVAVAYRMIDGPDGQGHQFDNNILEPQLQLQANDARVTIRVPVTVNGKKSTRDIKFQPDISREDFVSRVCAYMELNPLTAQLGWKSNDDPQCTPARQLETDDDLVQAFATLIKMKNSRRRQREVVMLISSHAISPPAKPAKKKDDGNKSTNFAYGEELLLIQEKLRCAQHAGPNRWCYISPENPLEHVQLSLEEVTLWARKLKDDTTLDRNCVIPPNCLSLDKLRESTGLHLIRKSTLKPELVPIHIHINNNAISESSTTNQTPSMKRTHSNVSISSDGSQDSESLPLSDILADLHLKFPKLNLPQYEAALEEHGIVYGESVADFDKNFYVRLGMAQGAVGPFLKGVRKAVKQQKRERKFARIGEEAKGYNRFESVEI